MGKLSLYWHTVKHLKPEQIIYRVTNKLKMDCSLGRKACPGTENSPISLLPQLDFDPVFLKRFPLEELMADRVTLLHETESFDWNTPWQFADRTPLWNYNLHYFEFLFPLIQAWRETKQPRYLDKIRQMLSGWIAQNPRENGGSGWDPYPTSLRLVNWLSCYGYLESDLDEEFQQKLIASMQEQYIHLSTHLEKHLLGNHYFENLKTLVICSIFFQDPKMTEAALGELKKQCAEQILPDGMHFELSPMYHKIILEDMLRVAAALRSGNRADAEIEAYIQPMLDVAYSLEEGLERIPLFNDCGDNITKSLITLLLAAKEAFGLEPQYKSQLPHSGYYIFKQGDWKLIVDAGQPGPDYLPGHAHCDAMSFELFHQGKPILVNCGTYAYQCKERSFFRSTAAHNTVMRDGIEQSQCWGAFRMSKHCRVRVISSSDRAIKIEMTDQSKNHITREFILENGSLTIKDDASCHLTEWIHSAVSWEQAEDGIRLSDGILLTMDPSPEACEHPYACEFGKQQKTTAFTSSGKNNFTIHVRNLL